MFSQKTNTKKLVSQDVYAESKYIRVYDEATKKYIWVIGNNSQNIERKGSNEKCEENISPCSNLKDKVKLYQNINTTESSSEV